MRLRILSSIALMIGFYILALGLAAGLLFAVYAELRWSSHISIRLTIFAVVTACVILWSILPRFDKFVAPGPRLAPESQPELFALVRGVAADTAEEMPTEVYLVADVNAFVTQRGGIAGIGSRRVMGIGLPLLQALTSSQLRAVIAHEFGHYAGGDLKLGAWIYKTRAAMGRTIQNLARTGSWAHRPFLAYGNFFMRVTQAVARAQEIAADRIAVRVAGARSHANALRAVHGASAAFGAYWSGEVLPVLSNGYQPPIGAGFARFMSAEPIAKAIDSVVEEELKSGAADPYDSHPPLKERLAAIGDVTDISPLHDDPPAIALLRDLPRLERELLLTMANDPRMVHELKAVEWQETPMQVFLPNWRDRAGKLATVLANSTAAQVPSLMTSKDLATALGVSLLKPEERLPEMQAAIASVLAAKLIDDGWSCTTSPGEQIVFTKNGATLTPFVDVVRDGENAEAWLERMRGAGVEELRLG
jgi:Zn-dependent protease with chaperone function